MKIISPKYDYCMKELFRNEIVRKAFLSDILGIPEEEIRTARLLNPFLRKRYKKQKLGILDILMGNEAADDWIRLLNAESEEDLEMIKTEKAGLREAIREVKRMSLSERLRARYEEHMKYIRDKAAREDYVWQQGRAQGRQEEKDKIISMLIADMQEDGKSREQVQAKLQQRFALTEQEAEAYLGHFWK